MKDINWRGAFQVEDDDPIDNEDFAEELVDIISSWEKKPTGLNLKAESSDESAAEIFDEHYQQIQATISRILEELGKVQEIFELDGSRNWGLVGSLAAVRENLEEILIILDTVEE